MCFDRLPGAALPYGHAHFCDVCTRRLMICPLCRAPCAPAVLDEQRPRNREGAPASPPLPFMEDAGVDEVARWLVDSVHLPQYEQAFRDNVVDGDMLLDIVSNAMLGELVATTNRRASLPRARTRGERREHGVSRGAC